MRPPLPTPPPKLQPRDATVLPLTTIFTPPQSCFNAPFTLSGSSSGVVGFSSAWRDKNETSSECYPPKFSSLQFDWSWYSPGVCASGYDVAQTSQPSDSPGVTQAWCCPTGYTITGWSSDNGLNYQGCTSLASNTAVISVERSLTTTFTPSFSFVQWQWPMSVEWAASDLSLFTPASAPAIVTEATSTIISGTGAANTGGTHQTAEGFANDNSGLSVGATVGIAIGAVVAVLAVLGAILFWWFKRRRSAQRIPDESDKGGRPFYVDQKIELPAEEPRQQNVASPIELDALQQQHELDVPGRDKANSGEPVELEGQWHGNETPGYRTSTHE